MKNCNKMLWFFLGLGLCFSLLLNYQRYKVEQANTQVETVMEYATIKRLAQAEGIPEKEAFQLFKNKGVTTLALFDTTLNKLAKSGDLVVMTGEDLLQKAAVQNLQPAWQKIAQDPNFVVSAVYIAKGTSNRALADVEEDLALRFGAKKLKVVSENPRIIRFIGDTNINNDIFAYGEQRGARELDLGLSSDELAKAKEYGFLVMARPVNYTSAYTADAAPAETQIAAFFQRLDKSDATISSLLGSGRELLGYPHNLPLVAQEMLKRKMTLGMAEGVTQLQFAPMDGLLPMAKEMNYQVARTYVIDKQEQKKLSFYDAFRRWALSDEERNIRINYIKTFLTPKDNKTLFATNVDYVEQITKSVAAKGYTSGKAGIFEAFVPSEVVFLPLAFAVVAACVMYLNQLRPIAEKQQYAHVIFFGIVISACLLTARTALFTRQMIALGAAVMYPVLTMNYMLERWEKECKSVVSLGGFTLRTTLELAGAVVCSLAGASLLGAVLGDIRFFLEIDIYRGVKLTFILPIILVALLFIKKYALWEDDDAGKSIVQRVLRVLQKPFTIKICAALAIFGFVAWVFVGRSGHTAGVPVPGVEMKLRLFLERVMYARPREKEFLIGHPAFYVAAYAAYKKLPNLFYFIFTLAATIGQGSLVQTFAHMRTPIIMSYIRAFDGLALGIILGIIVLSFIVLGYPLWQKLQRRLGNYE